MFTREELGEIVSNKEKLTQAVDELLASGNVGEAGKLCAFSAVALDKAELWIKAGEINAQEGADPVLARYCRYKALAAQDIATCEAVKLYELYEYFLNSYDLENSFSCASVLLSAKRDPDELIEVFAKLISLAKNQPFYSKQIASFISSALPVNDVAPRVAATVIQFLFENGFFEELYACLKKLDAGAFDKEVLVEHFLDLGMKEAEIPLNIERVKELLHFVRENKPSAVIAEKKLTELEEKISAPEKTASELIQGAISETEPSVAANSYLSAAIYLKHAQKDFEESWKTYQKALLLSSADSLILRTGVALSYANSRANSAAMLFLRLLKAENEHEKKANLFSAFAHAVSLNGGQEAITINEFFSFFDEEGLVIDFLIEPIQKIADPAKRAEAFLKLMQKKISPSVKDAALYQLGRVYEDELNEKDKAEKIFGELMLSSFANPDAWLRLSALKRRRDERMNLDETPPEYIYAAVLNEAQEKRLIERVTTATERIRSAFALLLALRFKTGKIYNKENVLPVLVKAVVEKSESSKFILHVLLEYFNAEQDKQVILPTAYELAKKLSEKSIFTEEALSIASMLLDADPAKPQYSEIKLKLLRSAGNQETLVNEIQERLKSAEGVSKRALQLELGGLLAGMQGKEEEAFQLLNGILESDIKDKEAADILVKLLDVEGETAIKAAYLLISHFEAVENYSNLAAVYENALTLEHDNAKKQEIALKAVIIWREKLNQPVIALPLYLKALENGPENFDDTQIKDIVALARDTHKLREAAEKFAQVAKNAGENESKLLKLSADIYLIDLGADAEALPIYEELRSKLPEDSSILDRLISIYDSKGAKRELISTLQSKLAFLSGTAEKAEAAFRAAKVCEELGDLTQEVELLKTAHENATEKREYLLPLLWALERQEEWWELISYLDIFAKKAASPLEAFRAGLRAAMILFYELNETGKVLERSRQLLASQERDEQFIGFLDTVSRRDELKSEALGMLADATRNAGDFKKLSEILPQLILIKDGAERDKLIIELIKTHDVKLSQKPRAFALSCEYYKLYPENKELRGLLEKLAQDSGMEEELTDLYEEILEEHKDLSSDARLELNRKLAELQTELNETAGAAKHIEEALAINPDDTDSREKLVAILRTSGNYRKLAEQLEVLRTKLDDESKKEAMLEELSDLYETNLGETEKAIAVLEELSAKHERDQFYLERLDHLYSLTENHEKLGEILSKLSEIVEDQNTKDEIEIRRAKLFANAEKYADAVPILIGLLERDARAEEAVSWLNEALSDAKSAEMAIDPLCEYYTKNAEWSEMVNSLEQAGDFIDNPEQVVSVLRRAAKIAEEKLNDKSRAFEEWTRLFLSPAAPQDAREQLERLAAEANRSSELFSIFEQKIENLAEPCSDSAVYAVRLAELSERSGDKEKAIYYYRRSLQYNEGHKGAVSALSRLYEETENWDDLIELINSRIVATEEKPARAALYKKLAEIEMEEKGNNLSAAEVLRNAIENDPADLELYRMLEGVLSVMKRYAELADMLEAHLALIPEDKTESVMLRLIRVRWQNLEEYEKAFEFAVTSKKNPAILPALIELFFDFAKSSEGKPVIIATGFLTEALAESENWQRAIEAWELRKNVKEERLNVAMNIAKIQKEKLDDPTKGFFTLVKEVEAALDNKEYLQLLTDYAREAETLEELVEILIETSEALDEGGIEALLKAAEVYDKELEKPDKSQVIYSDVLKRDPSNKTALDELDRFYRLRSEWDELSNILSKKLRIEEEPQEKADLYFRRARLFEQALESPDDAIEDYKHSLEIDSNNLPALHSLARLAAEQKSYALLADTTLKIISRLTNEHEIWEQKLKLARLHSKELRDPDRAIVLWRELKSYEDTSEEASAAIESLLEEEKRFEELAAFFEERLSDAQNAKEEKRLLTKLSELYLKQLGDAEKAKTKAEELLEREPDSANALRIAIGAYKELGDSEKQQSALERLYKLAGREDEASQKEVLLSQAQLLASSLNKKEEAGEKALAAWEIEPHSEDELETFVNLFNECGLYDNTAEAMFVKADLEEEEEKRLERFTALADFAEERVPKSKFLLKAYEEIRDIEIEHERAQKRLEELYEEHREWQQLCNLLISRLPITPLNEDKINLLLKASDIYLTKLQQSPKAFLTLTRGLGFNFLSDPLAEALVNTAKEAESEEELCDLWEEGLEDYEGEERANNIRLRLLRILATQDGAEERALKVANELIKLEPASEEAHKFVVLLTEKTGEHKALAEELTRRLSVSGVTLEERKNILSRLAQLYAENLDKADKAKETLEKLLDEFPEDEEALARLTELARKSGDTKYLLDVLERSLKVEKNEEDRCETILKRAILIEVELNEEDRAIAEYRRVLEIQPLNHKALNALDKIYTKREDFTALIGIIEKKIDAVASNEKKVALLKRLAMIYEEQKETCDDAITVWRKAEEIERDSTEIKNELARLLRRAKRTDDLVEILTWLSSNAEEKKAKIEALSEIGDIYIEKNDYAEAEKSYSKLLTLDEDNKAAWLNLATVFEKTLQWNQAIEANKRYASLTSSADEKAEHLNAAGYIAREYLQNNSEAIDTYKKVLDNDSKNLKAVTALREIYFEIEDYKRYIEFYDREASITENPDEKSRIYIEIGRFYQSKLNDNEDAARYFENALEKDIDSLPAAKPLSDYYFTKRMWNEAKKPIEVLVRHLDPTEDKQLLVRENYRLGYIYDQLGDLDNAIKYYRESFKLDATNMPTLEAFGRALIKAEKWQEAIRVHQALLLHHRDELDEVEILDVFNRLGMLFMRENELEKALKSFMRAFELNEMDHTTLANLVEVHTKRGEWEEVYDFRDKLAAVLAGEKQRDEYLSMARFCREKLQDDFRAIDALEKALDVDPENQEAIELAIRLYVGTQQAGKAVEMIEKALSFDISDKKKVIYRMTAGQIYRENLRERDKALAHFQEALRLDKTNVRAFAAVEEILSEKKEWSQLAIAYQEMIENTPSGERERLVLLYESLAELARRILKDVPKAVSAYEALMELKGEDATVYETVADLYEQAGDKHKAIKVYQKLVKNSATPLKAYRALRRLYTETRQVDAIANICGVLEYMKQAEDEDRRFYMAAMKKAPAQAERALTDILWDELLISDGAKTPYANILAILWRRVPELFGSQGGYAVDHKNLVDAEQSVAFVVNMFKYAVRTLNLAEPQLYRPPQLNDGVSVGTIGRDSLLAVSVNLFKSMDRQEILFALSTALTYTRPEYILAATRSRELIEVIVSSAVSAVEPAYSTKGDPSQIDVWRKKIVKALPPDAATELRKYATQLIRTNVDLDTWLEAAQITAFRAGLLLSTNLSVTMDGIERYNGMIAKVSQRKALREMMIFAASEEYFELRKKLKLDIKGREG